MVRGKKPDQSFLLAQYVNDRPYAASSFLSVAIAPGLRLGPPGPLQGPARAGGDGDPARRPGSTCCRCGAASGSCGRVFEPLGYEVEAVRHPLDERFPEWGESPYFSVTVRKTTTLADLLTHLYVLIPVFDNRKHYFVGDDEMEKLLAKGEGWLAGHPEKEEITRRYLKFQPSLYREALARLVQEEEPRRSRGGRRGPHEKAEEVLEKPLSLNEQRLGAVMAALRASGAKRVLDLGCGEGKLLRELLKDKQFEEIVGMDVSIRSLEAAQRPAQAGPAADACRPTGSS